MLRNHICIFQTCKVEPRDRTFLGKATNLQLVLKNRPPKYSPEAITVNGSNSYPRCDSYLGKLLENLFRDHLLGILWETVFEDHVLVGNITKKCTVERLDRTFLDHANAVPQRSRCSVQDSIFSGLGLLLAQQRYSVRIMRSASCCAQLVVTRW